MKITIVQGAFIPVPPILGGAVEKIYFKLGQEFVNLGHEVIHISRTHPSLEDKENINGVSHIRVKGFSTPKSLLILKFYDLIYTLRTLKHINSDIVVSNTFWLPIFFRNKTKGKIYVSVERRPKWQMKFYTNVSKFRACSPMIFDLVKEKIKPEYHNKVSYIPNPVPFQLKDFKTEKTNSILFVGRLDKEKGVHILIDAFNSIPEHISRNWTLNIVGPWEAAEGGGGLVYYQNLKNKKGNVNFAGSVYDQDALSKFYFDSKIFCYPIQDGTGDAGPVAPREAMSYGCATILSNHDCFNEYALDEINCLRFNQSNEDQIEQLTSQLIRLMTDSELREKISLNGRKVFDDFSTSKIAKMFIDDFQSVLNE
ncbi:glycosyltransferase family 4 protein [Flavobacterium sp. ACN6]|uniref:glycosyltransferase family 4 protein n=1 Tax=Flavobacterium sp. ACN6 TaxID=1920426 RepID=UPI000BB3838A|nr:glycosyltransferase family 4 protein [Flavobacterium sp. ACN6]PBJ08971.1 Glycosyl transferases group 1 [Flavobacterium sp. ACN6]